MLVVGIIRRFRPEDRRVGRNKVEKGEGEVRILIRDWEVLLKGIVLLSKIVLLIVIPSRLTAKYVDICWRKEMMQC